MSRHHRDDSQALENVGAGLGASLLAAVGGWLLYSTYGVNHRLPLPPAIDAEQERFVGQNARFLSYYVDKSASGRPLVLIHSINAAASAYEMRPIFQRYRGTRPVYALDLPGFGFSERADRTYSPALYEDAIIDFLKARVSEPADVIALSLGCEFAAGAALREPQLFHSLTMISPSGFTARDQKRATQQATQNGTSDLVYKAFSFPLWAQGFYDLLGTRASIHYFLQQSFHGRVDPGLAEYDYLTTHQPGARHAPLHFVSGLLFRRDIRERVYQHLKLPVLVLYDRDSFVRFDELPNTIAQNNNWRAVRIAPTKGLPQFEQMDTVAASLDAFWASIFDPNQATSLPPSFKTNS